MICPISEQMTYALNGEKKQFVASFCKACHSYKFSSVEAEVEH